jgi:hypothetical protein
MSDRREAVIEAMQAEIGDDLGWKRIGWERVADAAIAAMTTEPTDAEVEAGAAAIYAEYIGGEEREFNPWETTHPDMRERCTEYARAVLIAARKVSQP